MPLKYFQIKRQKGTNKKSLIFRERPKKYSKKLKETYIKKSKSILILGSHASGKTKELSKICNEASNIYKQSVTVYISAIEPLSTWFSKNLKKKDSDNFLTSLDEEERIEIEADIKKQHIKTQMLINKCHKAVLFIDDIDLMRGNKREIVKDMMRISAIIVCTAKVKQEIDKTLLDTLFKKQYEEIILRSDVSYDATNIIFVAIILAMITTGAYEMAMLIMAGRYITKGKDKK